MTDLRPETWTDDLLPRDLGPYQLTAVLGSGGTARVFEAHLIGPEGLAKPMALKLLRSDVVRPGAREMLLREAQLASLIRHPNVVDVLDLGEVEGIPFIAMERIEGLTLKQLLKGGPLAKETALDLLQQIAAGLTALHDLRLPGQAEHGLVHRDLKPANVLVDATGRVRLVDFGIAVVADPSSQTDAWGTLSYMSPEQAIGEPVAASSDVFSFGAILYEVLLGRKLWKRGRPADVIRALLEVERRLLEGRCLRQVEEPLPGAGGVLRNCLRFEAGERLPDGRAVWEAIEALRSHGTSPSGLHQRVQDRLPPSVAENDQDSVLHPPALVGRSAAMGWLTSSTSRLRTLSGPLGVGKSALAAVEAARVARSGRADVLVACLRGALAPGAVLQQVADCAQISAAALESVPQGVWALGEALASRGPVLLVLDDADGCQDELRSWVPIWLARAPGLRVLVSCRQALGVSDEHVLAVPPLDEKASVALLTHLSAQPHSPETLRRQAQRTRGLPLALQLAASGDMTSETTGPYTESTGDLPRHVLASLRSAWQGLSLSARDVLSACTVFRDGFTLGDAVKVLDAAGLHGPGSQLALLTDRGLLRRRMGISGHRLVLDQPLFAFAATRLEEDPRRQRRLVRAHATHFARLGSDAAVATLAGPRATELQSRWVDERANLGVALERCLDAQLPQLSARLGRALLEVRRLGHPVNGLPDFVRRLARLQQITPQDRLRLDLSRGQALLALGKSSVCEDLLRSVGQRAREQQESLILCQSLVECARLMIGSGHYTRAQQTIDEAQDVAEEGEHRSVLPRCLRVRAVLQRRRRDLDGALESLGRAGRMCRALADHHLGCRVDSLAALVCMDLGKLERGIGLLSRVVADLRKTPDKYALARQLGNLGVLYERSGQVGAARRCLIEGLSIYQRVGALGDVTHLRQTLGSVALVIGDLDASLAHHKRAVELVRRLGKRDQLAMALMDQGLSLRHQGQLVEAREVMEGARSAAADLGQTARVALCDANLAELCFAEGDVAGGGVLAEDLLTRPEVQRVARVLGCVLGLAGEAARRRGDLEGAQQYMDQAVVTLRGADPAEWRDLLIRKARLDLDLGRLAAVQQVVDDTLAYADSQEMTHLAPLRRAAAHLGREVARSRKSKSK
jgi:tetratricopeptide (TPR) repeat protein/tRNA A-37 threonylcarbamoyl transferase component Bud32